MASADNELTRTFELVRRAQGGDDQALGQLLDRYYERVRAVVRRRLGSKLRSLVDSTDILQITCVNAIRCFQRFDLTDEDGWVRWLSKIAERAINGVADHANAVKREVGRQVPLAGPDDSGSASGPAQPGDGPATQAAANEEAASLVECLRRLPAHYQEVIQLRDYQRLSWREVGEAIGGRTEDAARMLHAKAVFELGKLVRHRQHEA